ncbi:MAG: cytochrome c oxidase subunit 4 [Microbacteriaceae bacterium]|nr:MAG: cytochrome c oxidase subunit 4 [Microbacteriaceae bacterium]
MRASSGIFWVIAAFFWTVSAMYTIWGLIYYHGRVEWVGTIALGLTGILGAFIGFYLGRSHASQGGELPEDRLDGNIDDGDPELGHFSPWSWWPMLLAGSVGLMALGLAVGFWMCYIAVPLALVCLVGWVFEYYRGYFAR